MAFDRPEPTFRKQEFVDYKAKRPEAAPELISQIIAARDLFKLFGIACFEVPGFEADDIIGTLAEDFKSDQALSGGKIIILSGDHDVLQLVKNDTVIADIIKRGTSETTRYNEAAVKGKYGLPPAQLTDYKGLVGDPSDNIPGVKGIGPKGARELLEKYGSLQAVLDDAALIPGTLGKKIEGQEEIARFSKKLATIRRDVPLDIAGIEALHPAPLDRAAVRATFERWGFKSLVNRLPES